MAVVIGGAMCVKAGEMKYVMELLDPHLGLVIQNKNKLLGDASKAINGLC